ncbi:hypothetical protein QDY63_14820 [Pseudomonas brenneri]|uniref:hypothetical protein n=1 Tax=Pseudomonas brenneri TaxID=129817 RepID=UPI0025A1AF86|nr:hypothetical protein [Pseudomonas brenneri]WJM88673.1 hypothetical protein QDY63_14820 [Pseudomonas brenneri]
MFSLEKLLELAQLGLFAVAGAVAKQCHRLLKGDEPFSLPRFLLHLAIALFAGITVGKFIPLDVAYRDGIILMVGFTAQPLLDILEGKFLSKTQEVIK